MKALNLIKYFPAHFIKYLISNFNFYLFVFSFETHFFGRLLFRLIKYFLIHFVSYSHKHFFLGYKRKYVLNIVLLCFRVQFYENYKRVLCGFNFNNRFWFFNRYFYFLTYYTLNTFTLRANSLFLKYIPFVFVPIQLNGTMIFN